MGLATYLKEPRVRHRWWKRVKLAAEHEDEKRMWLEAKSVYISNSENRARRIFYLMQHFRQKWQNAEKELVKCKRRQKFLRAVIDAAIPEQELNKLLAVAGALNEADPHEKNRRPARKRAGLLGR